VLDRPHLPRSNNTQEQTSLVARPPVGANYENIKYVMQLGLESIHIGKCEDLNFIFFFESIRLSPEESLRL